VRIAINLSPVQFRQKDLVAQVKAALFENGLPPARLELEITESLLLTDSEATIEALHELRAMGVRISMDDFGTGYSSLSYLRSFPFDKIKIDRSFMRDLTTRADSQAIIKAIIGLGHSLGMSTTAEGIETEEQLVMVREQGVSEVQGFLFSPPLSAAALANLLHSARAKGQARQKAS
jgi:EAL domain-containing protein (putative c-di-GMP-specific phosphodiesterase class I)